MASSYTRGAVAGQGGGTRPQAGTAEASLCPGPGQGTLSSHYSSRPMLAPGLGLPVNQPKLTSSSHIVSAPTLTNRPDGKGLSVPGVLGPVSRGTEMGRSLASPILCVLHLLPAGGFPGTPPGKQRIR